MLVGRNKPCPCGSGKKYKKCCGVIVAAPDAVVSDTPLNSSKEMQALRQVEQGNEFRKQGRLDEALTCYNLALKLNPDYASAYNGIGNISLALGKHDEALAAYDKAILIKPDFFAGHYNRGNVLQELNRYTEAVSAYNEALKQTSDDADVYANLGLALMRDGQCDAAVNACKKALHLNPDDMLAYNNMSGALILQGNLGEAENILLQGLDKQPDHVELCITLAQVYERQNRIDQAWIYVKKAIALSPHNLHAKCIMAALLRRKNSIDEGLSILSGLTIPLHDKILSKNIHFELARLFDRKHESDSAFQHFKIANKMAGDTTTVERENYFQAVSGIRHSFKQYGQELLDSIAGSESRYETLPVFLVGFPRSGTTLLEQVLDSHNNLRVLDEKPMLVKVLRKIASAHGNYLDILPKLSNSDVQFYRDMYWEEAGKYFSSESVQLIDKQPLNIVHCNLIAKLFPGARIIVNLRHPCDVCLSCFMQDFEANDAMANFATLEETVQLYVEIMGLFLEYEQTLPLAFQRFHYEGLIEDFTAEVSKILSFLEIPWSDNLQHYHMHAAGKEGISSASYSQVVEPLYTRAKYRWLRYRDYFQSHLPALRPFIEAFGYRES